MRLNIIGIFTIFTVLTVLRRSTHAVSAPYNVSVKCDSYGVTVEWMADGLSKEADFLLVLVPDFGNSSSVRTKSPQYNISALLSDAAYNHYFVKVKARDGDHESEFAESQIFSFNFRKPGKIICGLEFPEVNLFPRDGKLFVQFTNPLHLYRETPALHNLLKMEKLHYTVISSKVSNKCLNCSLDCPLECFSFECPRESDTCLNNVSFPEKQESYCVTLLGRIRQTYVRQIERCYNDTLNPGPPVTTYLIVVLGSIIAILIVALATVFLGKGVTEFIKKKMLSKFPLSLKTENILTSTPLITPLNTEPEPVAENPRVEPAVKIPPDSACCLQETTTHPETSTTTNIDDLTDCTEDKAAFTGSGSSQLEAGRSQDSCYQYGNGADLSGTDLSTGYDRPHVLTEMSPGDMVNNYRS